jgi:hypothetical protein
MNWTKATRKMMKRRSSNNWTTGLMYAALTGAAIWGVSTLIRRMGSQVEEDLSGDEM